MKGLLTVTAAGTMLLAAACTSGSTSDGSVNTTATPDSPKVVSPASRSISAGDRAIIESSRLSSSAPLSFRERTPLSDCGTHAPSVGQGLDLRSFDCLVKPPAEGAELTVLRRTVEGDPVVFYYRAAGGDPGIEVFTDSTLDDFGTDGWTHDRRSVAALTKIGL